MAGITAGKTWSRIGAEVAPTSSAAAGVWGDLNEVTENIGAGTWPAPQGSAMEPIETSTSTAASLTFTSIPQTYKHLWFVWTIPGNASNWGNAYTYNINNPVPTGSASNIFYQSNSSRAITQTDEQPINYGLKMAVGDDSVYSTGVQYHEFMWPYYSDSQGSGTTSRWMSALGQGYTGSGTTSPNSYYQYLTALNEDGASTTVMPITELTVKFGDGSALPSGTTRTLYGIGEG